MPSVSDVRIIVVIFHKRAISELTYVIEYVSVLISAL